MIEQQIDKIFLISQGQPVLASNEAETVAQFQDKISQPIYETIFQSSFRDCPTNPEKFEII